jgi:5-hydroxyisourate hydrolase-like protein (transthyretin family)
MLFDVAEYFAQKEIVSFYPSIRIEFETFDTSHYHIPLLLNPFGYSTYRGS